MTGRDGYKTVVRLVGAVPKSSKEGKHTYRTAAECRGRLGRLQNCSKISRGGAGMKQERQAYKTVAECQDGPGRLQNCSEIGRDGAGMKQEREAYL